MEPPPTLAKRIERKVVPVLERLVPRSLPMLRRWESPEAQKLSRQLGFKVQLMPSAQPPMFSHPVSRDWWVEVYREGQRPPNLPARAQERWMRACGLGLVTATLVYHERLTTPRPRDRLFRKANRFRLYTLPQWKEKVWQRLRQVSIPSQALLIGAIAVSGLVALLAFGGLALAAAAVGAVLHDPALVVIDRSNRWIILDVWYD